MSFAPAHTDWLYHHLTATGPAPALAAFRDAAAGAGIIPWTLDLDRMEEDYFLALATPSQRSLSLEGARMLAAELRDAVGRRHALATARVGHSRACPFDLQALAPVPADLLRLGPDHPDALAWLWAHWGTTQPLRHVTMLPAGKGAEGAFRVSFWSADWSPWRALETLRGDWDTLRLDLRPIYEPT